MLKHVYLIFGSTLLLGMVTGALLFMSSHTGQEGGGDIDEDTDLGYTVAVYTYGGCERIGCPLSRIAQDGEYIFIASGGERYTDTLPFESRREIGNALKATSFATVEASSFVGDCPIIYDGVAYRYEINYDGNEYQFDSCVQSLESEQLFMMLNHYFNVFSERHAQ